MIESNKEMLERIKKDIEMLEDKLNDNPNNPDLINDRIDNFYELINKIIKQIYEAEQDWGNYRKIISYTYWSNWGKLSKTK